MVGILAAGAYVPVARLQREVVAAAHRWFTPGLSALARGERAMANWDEDVVTMCVEAARDGTEGMDRSHIRKVVLGSTTAPFADRLNATIVKEALNLRDDVGTLDVSGSQRAGLSALLVGLDAAQAGGGPVLCVTGEKRHTQPASELELVSGDAAAALLVGEGDVAAEFLGVHRASVDFVSHFRATGQAYDYSWESRWVRDEGYGKIATAAVKAALAKFGIAGAEVDRFVMPAPLRGANMAVAKAVGIGPDAVSDTLFETLGDAGAAHPLVMLVHALETTEPGDIVIVVAFGSGCDVAAFRSTGRKAVHGFGVSGWLSRRRPEENYCKYLALRGHLDLDKGMRAEFDQKTPLTALYRNRKAVLGLLGGRCVDTGQVQYPSPGGDAESTGRQEPHPLAERLARVVTYTADSLTYSPNPPVYYGTIEFEGGGRMTAEFADVDAADIEIGAPLRMMFRVKAHDERRGFTRYFWKAVPDHRRSTTSQAA